MIQLPDISSKLGGSLGASGGFGKAGSGGGFGSGVGKGGMTGLVFKPISMFGRELKARRLGVVMDVSRSMTKHLPRVCRELDIVAKDSPLILYFGCGLMPAGNYKVDDEPHRVGGKDFERYWRVWQGRTPLQTPPSEWKTIAFDPDAKFPLEDIFKIVNKRRETYYIDFCGITHTWLALMSDRFRFCDAIYWFSDFQDKVDLKQIEKVRKYFKDHKMRLYIHASVRGRSFEAVRDELVLPLGGDVIEDAAK